ncbi:MAG: pyridoxal-phosphate dependent enzyme [Deltaproteobacteria bacterium]|nr:pyridoxal-phosphate dependent enzyme [Deltaproteobacteria bacterium]
MTAAPSQDRPFGLFLRYPALERRLPRLALLRRPSEVHALDALAPGLWIKRDDRAGLVYGGNKPRKLEFLLADAISQGTDTVLTFGAIGSHHALAVALCGKQHGLRMILVAVGQPPTPHVLETLRRILDTGARVEFVGSSSRAALSGARRWLLPGVGRKRPLLVMPGGSSPLGCVGFVEAALELEAQVQEGALPEPEIITVPVGSMGTAAGLLAGLSLTALRSRVLGVVVNDLMPISARRVCALADQTLNFLRKHDASFPDVKADRARLDLPRNWMGRGYGHPTPAGEQAIARAAGSGIALEGIYTGKTLAAVLDHMGRDGGGSGSAPLLFWNTFNSIALPTFQGALDPGVLPRPLRAFLQRSEALPAG